MRLRAHVALVCGFLAAVLCTDEDSSAQDKPVVNPRASLKLAESKTVWSSPDGKLAAQRARFSPDGKRLAWFLSDGTVMIHDLGGASRAVWQPPTGGKGRVEDLVWAPRGELGACVSWEAEDKSRAGGVVVWSNEKASASLLEGTAGAARLAWGADGRLAFSTKDALYLWEPAAAKAAKLLDQVEGWRPKGAPAYEDIAFAGVAVIARAAGSMRWTLAAPGGRRADLGECRGAAPDVDRGRLYLVPWLAGPAQVPRGAGVAWTNLRKESAARQTVVPSGPDGAYWLPDVWDWHYPSTLRVSPDGKTLSFLGVQVGVPSANPWREFCLWRVPCDGSAPPVAVAELGPIFKRIDVGRTWAIGWRYEVDNACLLVDLVGGRAWKLPESVEVQRTNTDVLVDRLLVGAARGKDMVVMRLEESLVIGH
jgi:hypothetical protein